MIIVDTALRKREEQGRPIRVGMIGAGFQGRGLANQIINSTVGMRLVAIANRTPATGERAYREAGLDPVIVEDITALESAIAAGHPAVTGDADDLLASEQIDCIVDVTGAVEFGAAVTLKAFDRGLPVVTMNAELDGTIGPVLAHRAREKGLVLTGVDGDQPGVQGNLIRFVRSIGVTPLVSGNIKGLQDEHRNPTTQEGFAKRWGQDPYMVTSFADGTKVSFEEAIVANAHGFTVNKRGMNGWDHDGHVDELTTRYDVDELRELGGIVDYVVGARPNPGIYVLGTHADPKQRHYLELYKLGKGPLYSFYTPYHLCHFEVPNTVARAVDFDDAALTPPGGPRVEVLAAAKRDLKAGERLDGLGGYDTYGIADTVEATRAQNLLPMGVAVDCTLVQPVAKDTVLTYDDVRVPEGRVVDQLRKEQDALFGPDRPTT